MVAPIAHGDIVTSAQTYRAALCLADALDVVADKMGREDAHAGIVRAHTDVAFAMCRALLLAPVAETWPSMPERADHLADRLRRGGPFFRLTEQADAWRSWGESLRASLQACPVCEEAKVEAPGPMCEDLHWEARHG